MAYDDFADNFSDFRSVTSAKRLRGCLLHGARILRRDGFADLADYWEASVKRMPQRISKDAINAVLLLAFNEGRDCYDTN